MCIEFMKPSASYNGVSHVANCAGTAAVVAVGGLALAKIAQIAFTALGYSDIVIATAMAIPTSLAVLAAIAAVGGGVLLLCELVKFARGQAGR